MINICVIEDTVLLRSALGVALSCADDVTVVASVGSPEVTKDWLSGRTMDVAVIDLDTQRASAPAAVQLIASELPECGVLALTRIAATASLRRALEHQVHAFLGKDCEVAQLVAAIRRVAAGERFIEAGLAAAALRISQNPLTPREIDVLRLVAEGCASGEIAAALFLTAGTVRNYLSIVMRKLGARSRLEAVQKAVDANWV